MNPITARRYYTQAQIDRIFANAAKAAEKRGTTNWDAYMLTYVSLKLGVELDVPAVTQ